MHQLQCLRPTTIIVHSWIAELVSVHVLRTAHEPLLPTRVASSITQLLLSWNRVPWFHPRSNKRRCKNPILKIPCPVDLSGSLLSSTKIPFLDSEMPFSIEIDVTYDTDTVKVVYYFLLSLVTNTSHSPPREGRPKKNKRSHLNHDGQADASGGGVSTGVHHGPCGVPWFVLLLRYIS